MIKPFLFIGVGGAGGKTLRAIADELRKQLNSNGYIGELPDAWQFLHIDTSVIQDGVHLEIPLLTPDEYHGAVPTGSMYENILYKVMELGNESTQREILATWALPLPEHRINRPRSMQRAIGRLISISDLKGIEASMRTSVSKMLSPQAIPQLEEVAKLLPDQSVGTEPEVFVFSSLTGGTGSGMFLDTTDILSSITTSSWAQNVNLMLYADDVFYEWRHSTCDFEANSLAVISELLARKAGVQAEETKKLFSLNGLIFPDSSVRRGEVYFLGLESSSVTSCDDTSENIGGERFMVKTGRSFATTIVNGDCGNWLANEPVGRLTLSADIYGRDLAQGAGILDGLDIESIAKPILEQINKSTSSQQIWNWFWEGRRTRPLVEAIPFTNENRRLLIIGWFVASVFGLRRIEYSEDGLKLHIWNPVGGHTEWLTYPMMLPPQTPFDESQPNWILPALLKSSTIALLNFADTKDPIYLEGFRGLRELGTEISPITYPIYNHDFFSIEINDNGESKARSYLKDWLLNGTAPSENMQGSQLTAREYSGFEERKAALLESIEKNRNHYEEKWASLTGVIWSKTPETWELREDINSALSAIARYVINIS